MISYIGTPGKRLIEWKPANDGNERQRTWKTIAKAQPILTRRQELGEATSVSPLTTTKCNGACYWLKLAHVTWSLQGALEKSGTCLQCVWQRSTRSIETLMVFQPDPVDFYSWQLQHIRVQNPTHSARCPSMHLPTQNPALSEKNVEMMWIFHIEIVVFSTLRFSYFHIE